MLTRTQVAAAHRAMLVTLFPGLEGTNMLEMMADEEASSKISDNDVVWSQLLGVEVVDDTPERPLTALSDLYAL